MQVTIEFTDTELEPAIQQHLQEDGVSVQRYIKNALTLYNTVRKLAAAGHLIGHSKTVGKNSNWLTYNTPLQLGMDAKGRQITQDRDNDTA